MKKNALFIIDAQNSFCDPKGELFVSGADGDMIRLEKFMKNNLEKLEGIFLTLDDHQVCEISHPTFWKDALGNNPAAYTIIKYSDLQEGKWTTTNPNELQIAKDYLQKLENQGKYPHIIWPEHCLAGSWGAAIYPSIFNQIASWAKMGNTYNVVRKGAFKYSEHFGAFAAEVKFENEASTYPNDQLAKQLDEFQNIIICGEAKSHCVANTISQMIELYPNLIKKLTILQDAMSPVTGFEHTADAIYQKAIEMGAKQITSDSIL